MKDKGFRLFSLLICPLCGLVGSVLLICTSLSEGSTPFWLQSVISVCLLLNMFGFVCNCRLIRTKSQNDPDDREH